MQALKGVGVEGVHPDAVAVDVPVVLELVRDLLLVTRVERRVLQLEQQTDVEGPRRLEELSQCRDPGAGVRRREPGARVEPLHLVPRERRDRVVLTAGEHRRDVGGAGEGLVVDDDEGPVGGALDVELDHVRAEGRRLPHGRQGVLRCHGAGATVSDDQGARPQGRDAHALRVGHGERNGHRSHPERQQQRGRHERCRPAPLPHPLDGRSRTCIKPERRRVGAGLGQRGCSGVDWGS